MGLRTFLNADDRIEKVAAFVAEHFTKSVLPLGYKAFLVAVNREACAKYKRALDKLLPPEWTVPVYSENAQDVVMRPLVAELQLSAQREADTRLMFKKTNEDPKILIVTDKLLTGFDAPLLYCMYLDKPMRDHVLLQAIARVNRPYVDGDGNSKSIGLVVDFVGVLRELRKALQFDSSDVSGVIEDIDLLLQDFRAKIAIAKTEYLDGLNDSAQYGSHGDDDSRLEQVVFGRFLSPEAREQFYSDYKEIEVLWEILSPAAALRDHIETYRQLVRLYAVVRNAYSIQPGFVAELAHQDAAPYRRIRYYAGPRRSDKSCNFRPSYPRSTSEGAGTDEAKVFNLVRGLQAEVESEPDLGPVLQPLKERAEHVLRDLEERRTSGLAAMDMLESLAKEKESVIAAATNSVLSPRAFGVYWILKDDHALKAAGVNAIEFAQEAQTLVSRFPNAAVNPEEQRQLRARLYRPLLRVDGNERRRIIDHALAILLEGDADEDM